MLSASLLASARAVAMLSPSKNPCRVRNSSASQYRYDPYVSKVLPSPLKTTMNSPQAAPRPVAVVPEQAAKNSLFASHVTAAAPALPELTRPSFTAKPMGDAYRATAKPSAAPQRAAESAMTHYAVIHFKHDSATFIAPFRVAVGDYVVVEGDRGEDLGVIQDITTETPSYPVPSKILRRASSRDKEQLKSKVDLERRTVEEVQSVANGLGLKMEVIDTEFQYDMNKLTVYFHAVQGHTDFRKLQRALFRVHRCRIWLANMEEVEYNAKVQETRRTR